MISAFGVEHGDEFAKKKGGDDKYKPAKAAAVGALAGGVLIPRVRANHVGARVGNRVASHGRWSEGRAKQMISPTGKKIRSKYASTLQNQGKAMARSDDTREVTGRATSAGIVGTGAGGVSYLKNKKKAD